MPVQVQWPQTVAVIFNPSSGGDTAHQRSERIRQAIQETGKIISIIVAAVLVMIAASVTGRRGRTI